MATLWCWTWTSGISDRWDLCLSLGSLSAPRCLCIAYGEARCIIHVCLHPEVSIRSVHEYRSLVRCMHAELQVCWFAGPVTGVCVHCHACTMCVWRPCRGRPKGILPNAICACNLQYTNCSGRLTYRLCSVCPAGAALGASGTHQRWYHALQME